MAAHKDTRTVATDALETLGKIHRKKEKRDAIHLAVEPVEAGEDLEPGSHITVSDGIATFAEAGKGLGIVDPFLTKVVKKGQRFWFVMYPRMVRSLRHVWTHPDFPDEPDKWADPQINAVAAAENSIREHASNLGLDYEELLEYADRWLRTGDFYIGGEKAEGYDIEPDEFWKNWELVTGRKCPIRHRHNFISCSC